MVEPLRILVVEDNPADVLLVKRALAQHEPDASVEVVRDGSEALAYLRHEGEYANSPKPSVVLLDLNLPRMSGHEVLAELREDEKLRSLPVIILTSSDDPRDIGRSYDLGARSYMTKRPELDAFLTCMGAFSKFWLQAATLPVS